LRPRALRWLGWPAVALLVLWLGGLAVFVADGLTTGAEDPAQADAIVVLTGGKQRLETGLALLAAGTAKTLFISGVNPQVDRAALLRALGPAAGREACCIVLGRQAENTRGNAQETAGWMQGEGYRSLRLVTSWYHMPRSLLEFRRAMPLLTILAHPVFAHGREPDSWWGRHGAALLVLVEYHKYLAAWLLDAALPPPSGPAPALRSAAGAPGSR
jgi:uncharacterized SAM-binding protein YcdF (DUF218 family)